MNKRLLISFLMVGTFIFADNTQSGEEEIKIHFQVPRNQIVEVGKRDKDLENADDNKGQ